MVNCRRQRLLETFVFTLATFRNSIVLAQEASWKTGMPCVINKFYRDEFLKQNLYISQELQKNQIIKKTISGPAEDIDLILLSINSNPVYGESIRIKRERTLYVLYCKWVFLNGSTSPKIFPET
jgi:hypothetical protein